MLQGDKRRKLEEENAIIIRFVIGHRNMLRATLNYKQRHRHKYANEDVPLGSWFIRLDAEHIDERRLCCGTLPGIASGRPKLETYVLPRSIGHAVGFAVSLIGLRRCTEDAEKSDGKAESWKENFRKECKTESFLVSILLTEAFRNVMLIKFGDKKTVVDPQDAELFGIKLALEVYPNYAKNIRLCSDSKSSIDTLNRCLPDQAKLNMLNDRVRDKVNDIISLVNEKQDTQIVFEHLDRNVRPTADAVANFAKKHFGDQAGEIRKVSVRGQYDYDIIKKAVGKSSGRKIKADHFNPDDPITFYNAM
ncbi:hypothetical protein OROMI_003256 [Orobanche minor]